MKIWTSTEKGDDKIIAYSNEYIYKANPPIKEIDSYVLDLKLGKPLQNRSFSIPLHYISMISQQEGKEYIEVIFKGDYEHLKINDDRIRTEVFEFLKQNIPGATSSIIKISKFQAAKKPLIAMGVILVLFLWCLYLALNIESGDRYGIEGSYRSLAALALAIASMGVNKVIFLFGSLLLIAGIAFYKKYKNPPIKNILFIKR